MSAIRIDLPPIPDGSLGGSDRYQFLVGFSYGDEGGEEDTYVEVLPTGAMSSGDYVAYMIDYMDDALSSLSIDTSDYAANQTVTDWYTRWQDVCDNVEDRISVLGEDISKIQSQIIVLKNVLDGA